MLAQPAKAQGILTYDHSKDLQKSLCHDGNLIDHVGTWKPALSTI